MKMLLNRALLIALAALSLASCAPSAATETENSVETVGEDVGIEPANVAAVDDAKIAECLSLGFDAEALDCRVCHSLAESLATQLEGDADDTSGKKSEAQRVVDSCKRCCTDVEAINGLAGKHNYARVVLEVCTCKFGRLPKVANFVHHHAANHPRLEIKYLNARYPHLIFYDDAGEKKEEVSIASWDEETISEFIEAKLKPLDDAAQPETSSQDESQDDKRSQQEEEETTPETDVEQEDDEDGTSENEVLEVEVSADGE